MTGTDAERRTAEEQLHQAQQAEALGQLTDGITHEFNNVLAGIAGALHLIGRELDPQRDADALHFLGVAQSAAKRAANLRHRLDELAEKIHEFIGRGAKS